MDEKKKKIFNRLEKAYEYVGGLGLNPIFTALYGSQNYGLDTEESDIDIVCFVFPALENLFFEVKISKNLEFHKGKLIICDIRAAEKRIFKHFNPVDIEPFVTEYFFTRDEQFCWYLRASIQALAEQNYASIRLESYCTMQKIKLKKNEPSYSKKLGLYLRYWDLIEALDAEVPVRKLFRVNRDLKGEKKAKEIKLIKTAQKLPKNIPLPNEELFKDLVAKKTKERLLNKKENIARQQHLEECLLVAYVKLLKNAMNY